MRTSKLYTINLRDILHGLIMSVGTAVMAAVESAATTSPIAFNYKQIGMAAACAGFVYLGKRFLTPSQNITKP